MPPKTRSKNYKASKENIGVSCKTKTKATNKVAKLPRKALADKTNSASDENASFLQYKPTINVANNEGDNFLSKQRPRRNRRLPNKYLDNNGIHNLSMSIIGGTIENNKSSKHTPFKSTEVVLSPLKTSNIILDSSLTAKRPKRICRLPSKFDDHSISPSKYVPVQPAYASTPKVMSKSSALIEKKDSTKIVRLKKTLTSNKVISTKVNNKLTLTKQKNAKKISNTPTISSANSSADTNNNAKKKLPHCKTKKTQCASLKMTNTKASTNKNFLDKNVSIKILENRKKSLKRDASNFDVYEFTYDPNEEPPPQKKKRRRPTKKREPKPKAVVFKDNYDKNMAKALTALKSTISAKSVNPIVKVDNAKELVTKTSETHPVSNTIVTPVNTQPVPSNPDKSHTSTNKYNSVRVEDIALDFDQDSCIDDVNYSPVHSFCRPNTPALQNTNPCYEKPTSNNRTLDTSTVQNNIHNVDKVANNNDPLNLRDDLSFFDDHPVASSSMNISARNPAASPWRVEFENLPIKWQVNTYVKPNMTPAFESSFMNFNDSKKKHIYTNIVPDTNVDNDLPQIYEDYASKLKQTSIISFIKEVVEKNAKKKKEKMTPNKVNTLFENPSNTSAYKDSPLVHETPKKGTQNNNPSNDQVTYPNQHLSKLAVKEVFLVNTKESEIKNSDEIVKSSSNKKKKDENVTYFGFDDSEDHDQENVSPVKKVDKRKLRTLKPRSRAVLQEINEQKGPTRAILPIAMKSKPISNTEAANKLFDQMKSGTEPPAFLHNDPIQSTEPTNITEAQNNEELNDDQSVHLFEDIEVVHHLKAHRKSYGKAKKAVTFRQNSISDSDVPPSDMAEQSSTSDEDDLHDLTFKVPAIEPKKTTRKKKYKRPKISKKEEQEVEAWAAGFNSMCEDIEEFDLVVE